MRQLNLEVEEVEIGHTDKRWAFLIVLLCNVAIILASFFQCLVGGAGNLMIVYSLQSFIAVGAIFVSGQAQKDTNGMQVRFLLSVAGISIAAMLNLVIWRLVSYKAVMPMVIYLFIAWGAYRSLVFGYLQVNRMVFLKGSALFWIWWSVLNIGGVLMWNVHGLECCRYLN